VTRRPAAVALALALLSASGAARAQDRGSDVGGAVAKRKVTKMPVLVRFVEADYPEARKTRGETAEVVLAIEIGASGEVTRVTVATSAGPDFDAAAVKAAQRFVFEPAEVDGKPAPAKILYKYSFVLRDEPPPPPAPAPPPPAPAPRPAPPPAPGDIQEVQVVAPPRAPRDAAGTKVSAAEGRRVAGTQGDVLKVIQNLPGVSRPPLASGQVVVWGSAPRETKIYVDGVEIPALYHGSGLRSVVSSDLVASVELVPGAFAADYGRGTGGLVRVETRPLSKQGVRGYVGADTLDASGLVSAPIGAGAVAAIGARYSYLDELLPLVTSRDVGDAFPIPRYRDVQGKLSIDLRERERLDLVVLASSDAIDRTVPSPDPGSVKRQSERTSFERIYAVYDRVTDDGDAVRVVPSWGHDASASRFAFGGTPAELETDAQRYGVRASYRTRLVARITGAVGLDAQGIATHVRRFGSLTLPSREGDPYVFGQPPGDEVALDEYDTHVLGLGPWVQAELRYKTVTITPGLRAETFLIESSKRIPPSAGVPAVGSSRFESAFDPRVSVAWSATPRLAYTASGGTYHQAPEPDELSAVFGTPALGLSKATHASLTQAVKVTGTLSIEATGFWKSLADVSVRSRLPTPKAATVLVQNGEGKSYGFQVLARQEMWRGFFGWVSYTLSHAERRYGDEEARLFDFDQPHVLAVVASQEVGRWTFGARFRAASGLPRTEVVGSTYDAKNDRYDPLFGPQNGLRIPAFWQLDAKIERSFALGAGLQLAAFLDVQNVTARQNAEEIVYSNDYRRRDTIRGLPTLAVVGVRLER